MAKKNGKKFVLKEKSVQIPQFFRVANNPSKNQELNGGKTMRNQKKNAKFKKHIKQKKTDLCSPLLLPTSPLNESIYRGGAFYPKCMDTVKS